jgi:AAA15 family ATPase/GTPase
VRSALYKRDAATYSVNINMKISKVSIKDYRSCKSVSFSPHERLSVLIGPNGSGKTNILSALKLLFGLLDVRRRPRYHMDSQISDECELTVWFEWRGKSIKYTAKINAETNERNEDDIISSQESWYMYEITGTKRRLKIPLELLHDLFVLKRRRFRADTADETEFLKRFLTEKGFDDKVFDVLSDVVKYISDISYYSASQFTNPSNCPLSFEVESVRESGLRRGISIRSPHKAFLYDMYIGYKEKSDSYEQFIDIVCENGIGLIQSVEFNEIKTSSSRIDVSAGGKVKKKEKINSLIVPGFKISNNLLSPSQLSEGTFKTLALVFYLITDTSSLLMIEEPEVCVHHGLLSSIIELINVYSNDKQIMISTHSDTVLDSVSLENIFSVKRDSNYGTIVKNIRGSMAKKDLASLQSYLEEEGSLGEYWKHGDLEIV